MNESDLAEALARLNPEHRDLFEERAAIMEYDGGLTRDEAERRALACILGNHEGQ